MRVSLDTSVRSSGGPITPALLTGTSSEYLGRRPLPRILRDRPVTFVLGPDGSGKTSVGMRVADIGLTRRQVPKYLDCRAVQKAVLDRVRIGRWSARLMKSRAMVLDGPVWLRNRQGVVDVLSELLRARAEAGRRTVVVQSDSDGSLDVLMDRMSTDSYVLLGLRFPKGVRGRLRFARRMCDELEIDREAARGSQHLEPWRYTTVIEHITDYQQLSFL